MTFLSLWCYHAVTMLIEKERKDKVIRFKIGESARNDLIRAAALAGAEDLSEWARKTLIREARAITQVKEDLGIPEDIPEEDIFC